MLRLLSYFIIMLAAMLAVASPWDTDSIVQMLAEAERDPIEGIWQFPDDGARLLIIKTKTDGYDLILLESPRLDVAPGTTIGRATATPKAGVYETKLDNRTVADKRVKKSSATLTLTKSGYLQFSPYSTNKSVSFFRWIPYFFRVTVHNGTRRPDGLDGAYRLDKPKPCL